jgi:hypothetical protein
VGGPCVSVLGGCGQRPGPWRPAWRLGMLVTEHHPAGADRYCPGSAPHMPLRSPELLTSNGRIGHGHPTLGCHPGPWSLIDEVNRSQQALQPQAPRHSATSQGVGSVRPRPHGPHPGGRVDRVVAPGCRVHAAWPPAQLGDWQGVPTPLVSALCSGHPPCSCSFEHPAWEAADLSLCSRFRPLSPTWRQPCLLSAASLTLLLMPGGKSPNPW